MARRKACRLCGPGHPTATDLHGHPAVTSADFAGIGPDGVGGPTTTRRTRADSAPPRRTPAGQRHRCDAHSHSDRHNQAKRDGGHSTWTSLTACAGRAPRDSQPCWQPHCHAAISPVRGAVKFPVSPLCLAGSVLPPLPKGPGMPPPSRLTRTTPAAPCQRTRPAARAACPRSLADRGGRSCRPTIAPRTWVSPNRPPTGSFQRGHVENRPSPGCLEEKPTDRLRGHHRAPGQKPPPNGWQAGRQIHRRTARRTKDSAPPNPAAPHVSPPVSAPCSGADSGRGRVRFLVATASPALGADPAEAAWLPLRQTWPRRRLIDLADVDDEGD
jgi:hypothetical protein